MTRGQIKANLRVNLSDLGVTFYSDDDLNDSMQDAYDDIVILTQCISKNTTLYWQSNLSYYNFSELGVTDYLGCTALFNNVTNRWLRDDLNLRDFDRLRRDWETWTGTPQFWAPSDPKRIAIAAKYAASGSISGAFNPAAFTNAFHTGTYATLGTFVLYYWATAPTLSSDSSTFLIASDMQTLLEYYVTADQLETAQEFSKANEYWEKYYIDIETYAERVKAINKSDLLLRV
jgi:hypothetical protein